ncbi:MAG: adenosylcobinamide amidohydrolase [Ornithinimicrobium sp.]|uniref:adenosylcobinamide amidohydrolase n=1 Tax=Ornithinimicrobium sp. TaxID=1977084 RepID=UPI0026DEBB46|nr:adenosylcobinamide amidohydrolase [Ornithinimicrobium sp.]MDO5740297.1 adenosylcobinamide amidohydrolase [Ornithinimicrobium sp.]
MVTMTRHLLADRRSQVLSWSVPSGWVALSSAAVGGGLVRPSWVVNIGVDAEFVRTDLERYAQEVAAELGHSGAGCALLTAADVSQVEHADCGGVRAWATVGVTKPTWPLAPGSSAVALGRPDGPKPPHSPSSGPPGELQARAPGTINIVVALPKSAPLSPSALVQAVGTITEAKSQVLLQAGVPGTGTASDAVVVLSAPQESLGDPVAFAGVRSEWGQLVAQAVHTVVAAGLAAHPWPPAGVDPKILW